MEHNLIVRIRGPVMDIRIDRPEKKNALTRAMYQGLTAALQRAEREEGVRVVVLSGTGGCFCAGHDLADFFEDPPRDLDNPMVRFVSALPFLDKPLVAAVEGPAVGVGATLLLHCDLVYAGQSAIFQFPFVPLGLVPEAGSTLLLPALMGHPVAAELLLLGEPFDARRALETGMINRVCGEGEALEAAMEAAGKLTARPPEAVRLTRLLMKKAGREWLRRTIEEEARLLISRLASPEAREALRGFLEKSNPGGG